MKKQLLSILVCPKCKGPLVYKSIYKSKGKQLICQKDRLVYPVRNGIPVLLASEARDIDKNTGI